MRPPGPRQSRTNRFHGLNRAIREARGEIIIRMDAHTIYAPDYVRSCVEVLQETNADNVGGPALTRADGYIAQAIALAFHTPFASGGAKFRDPRYEGPVDTVPYGCWRKSTLERIGMFDEKLVRGQDYELNVRIVSSGGTVWQSPKIISWYSAQSQPFRAVSAIFSVRILESRRDSEASQARILAKSRAGFVLARRSHFAALRHERWSCGISRFAKRIPWQLGRALVLVSCRIFVLLFSCGERMWVEIPSDFSRCLRDPSFFLRAWFSPVLFLPSYSSGSPRIRSESSDGNDQVALRRSNNSYMRKNEFPFSSDPAGKDEFVKHAESVRLTWTVIRPLSRRLEWDALPENASWPMLRRRAVFVLQSVFRSAFDRICAVAGLAVLSPAFALIALAIKLDDGGPIFYSQFRAGKGFQKFRLLKFRSMTSQLAGGSPVALPHDPRITRVGRILRDYKLDELPQLVNVLKGEMQLVGARPPLTRHADLFPREFGVLLQVPPGITDLASLCFRNEIQMFQQGPVEEQYIARILPNKLQVSLKYYRERTFFSDLGILFRTVLGMKSPARFGEANLP